MDIKKVTIKNWQCIDFLTLSFEKMMIFIGESNHGKTSIINALSAGLGFYEVEKSDFKDKTKEIEIKIKFFDKTEGFSTIKFIKNTDLEDKYFYINRGIEKQLNKEEFKSRFSTTQVIKISSKEMEVKESLIKIKDILNMNKTKNFKILNDLAGKIEFLDKNRSSPSLQRRVLFSFLKNTLNELKSYPNKQQDILDNTILIFEEPELHLNPQISRELYSQLIKLSNIGIQIVIETHSSYFVGLKQYKSICLVKKVRQQVIVFQHTGQLFNGDEIKNFNMNYWINPDRGEMFFAKKVILVEGQTDKIAISYLAKKLEIYNYNYSIVECGSKSTIPQFIKILNAYRIPYVAVYDKDNHLWRNEMELESSNDKNKRIRKMINTYIGNYIEFENDIEEEIYSKDREKKNYKNKPYFTLQKISEDDYNLPIQLQDKIKKIYK
ncbi:TOPRIM nucleotidyl transferase/hydrolase domain-containing protein [uncultured Cetobacterium sp.]|uniref:ATP-dependent nuclease n=1 Tax=uncultured Cetobacterium sp. TaxID=527638 RepID=UPI00260A77DC|nr:TOPRIM nucleotidyl transferase/hydrolase domain-containing protein [uncultured Cetobacterium sp.]